MSDQSDDKKKESSTPAVITEVDKTQFGGITPLTAAQIITLLIMADTTYGGACY